MADILCSTAAYVDAPDAGAERRGGSVPVAKSAGVSVAGEGSPTPWILEFVPLVAVTF